MTKLLIEESVVRQALEALENAKDKFHGKSLEWLEWNNNPAITALRTALDAAEGVEPVAWCVAYDDPAFGRIHSNPTMSKMQAEATIENAAAQLVLCELFTHPAPAVPEKREMTQIEIDRENQHKFSMLQFEEVCKGTNCTASKAMPYHSKECEAEHEACHPAPAVPEETK